MFKRITISHFLAFNLRSIEILGSYTTISRSIARPNLKIIEDYLELFN